MGAATSIISAATGRCCSAIAIPQVMAAVHAQLDRGTHYGASHELEIEWAECVKRLIPTAERVRFTAPAPRRR